ncbi:hypothetical protein BJX64DRAFT_270703 [Aspergillus heterothallicus]
MDTLGTRDLCCPYVKASRAVHIFFRLGGLPLVLFPLHYHPPIIPVIIRLGTTSFLFI